MQDAVTSLIKNYDRTGRYLDRDALNSSPILQRGQPEFKLLG
jgi:hypothetical protein